MKNNNQRTAAGSITTPEWLTEKEVAGLTGLRPQTLAAMRCLKRGGPPYYKIRRNVRYKPADVLAWVESQRVESSIA